jgi:hypothetical protein
MLIKPTEKIIAVGNPDTCGTIQMISRGYVTGIEREAIDAALAPLPMRTVVKEEFAIATYKKTAGVKLGDWLDYLNDSKKVPLAVKTKIEEAEWVLELIKSEQWQEYTGKLNYPYLVELKTFTEMRIEDATLAESVKKLSVEEFRSEAFCLLRLLDYLFAFAQAENLSEPYNNALVDADENQLLFLLITFPAKEELKPEPPLECLTPNSTLLTLDGENDSETPPSQELAPF